jgi:hypothetical protein
VKRAAALLCIFAVGAACTRNAPPLAIPSNAKPERRFQAKRLRRIDDALARTGDAQRTELVSPLLADWALQEFSARMPAATTRESSLKFIRPGVAEFSIVYSLPDMVKLRTQTIEFVYEEKQWSMFWRAESATESLTQPKDSMLGSAGPAAVNEPRRP